MQPLHLSQTDSSKSLRRRLTSYILVLPPSASKRKVGMVQRDRENESEFSEG